MRKIGMRDEDEQEEKEDDDEEEEEEERIKGGIGLRTTRAPRSSLLRWRVIQLPGTSPDSKHPKRQLTHTEVVS